MELSIWVVRAWNGDPVNRAPQEHDQMGWVSATELGLLRLADRRYPTILRPLIS